MKVYLKYLCCWVSILASTCCFAGSVQKLCTGDRVVTVAGIGTVVGLLSNGNVILKFEGYENPYDEEPTDNLARTSGCARDNSYCVGNRVNLEDDLGAGSLTLGTIAGILPNGNVMVHFDGYQLYDEEPVNDLALVSSSGCIGTDCTR